jgi:hypothetical protein
LIAEGKAAGTARKTFIYVNNRLEGNALATIDAMLESNADQNRCSLLTLDVKRDSPMASANGGWLRRLP